MSNLKWMIQDHQRIVKQIDFVMSQRHKIRDAVTRGFGDELTNTRSAIDPQHMEEFRLFFRVLNRDLLNTFRTVPPFLFPHALQYRRRKHRRGYTREWTKHGV